MGLVRLGATSTSGQLDTMPKDIKYLQPFEPLDWQKAPFMDTSPTMLLTGSAGGGKSRVCAEKIHAFCLRYPGATALILRKVRATMANSTLLFLKRVVIGDDPRVTHRPSDFRFEYDNGSILAYGGMKDDEQAEHIRSIGQDGGLDIVWMEEATQFAESDFNEVTARMRGRAAPWRQIILSTNPDAPGHWINVRLILGGEASVYYSSAIQNSYNPDDYVTKTLANLSGVQYRRLVAGEWAAGTGRVIDTWLDDYNAKRPESAEGNVRHDAVYVPNGGPVFWAIDDGYSGKMDAKTRMFTDKSHPRAIMMVQQRADGRLVVFNESVKIQTLAYDHIAEAIDNCQKNGWPMPVYVVRDRAAASLEGALNAHGLRARHYRVTVEESIKELRTWVAADQNGVRKVLVNPSCFYTRYQMQTYSYNDDNHIIKAHDDTIDALRYLVWDIAYGVSPAIDIATIESVVYDQRGI